MRKLMAHQRQGLVGARLNGNKFGLFMAPGTGKTLTAIRWVPEFPCLILCRRDDYLTWEIELGLENRYDIEFVHKGNQIISPMPWVAVTYDLFKNPKVQKQVMKMHPQTVVADESHLIKRWKSQRTKKIIRGTKHIPNRLAMTGSPITNDQIDVFSQCLFIDGGKTFGNNEYWFRRSYYIQQGPGWYLKRGAKERIGKKLKQCSYYVHEDDVMKLPPASSIIKSVPMTGVQRRFEQKILEDWEFELKSKGKIVEIDLVIVQLMKLKQIASGFIYDDEKNSTYLRSHKYNLLLQLLKDYYYKPKIVIWASFNAEIQKIKRELDANNISNIVFEGSPKQRVRARKAFRDDKDIRCFISQVDRGVGMNELVVSDLAIYFSNSNRVVSRLQSMRRIRRKGSERHKRITYIDLITEKSIDLKVLQAVKNNMNIANYILNYIKAGGSVLNLNERVSI